jgi:hypothetical protein
MAFRCSEDSAAGRLAARWGLDENVPDRARHGGALPADFDPAPPRVE